MESPLSALLSAFLRYSKASTQFTVRVLQRFLWPKIDTLIRLGLAQAFFISGVMKLTHWGATLAAANHEFPLRFMAPVTAAYGGVSICVFHAMPVRDFTACRSNVSSDAGPGFHGMSVQDFTSSRPGFHGGPSR
jgi:hypothetical protein